MTSLVEGSCFKKTGKRDGIGLGQTEMWEGVNNWL